MPLPPERLRTIRLAAISLILIASGLSFLMSIYLWFFVGKDHGLFVGLWVPSILAFGILILQAFDELGEVS